MIRLPVFILEPRASVMASVAHSLEKDPQVEVFALQTAAEVEQWVHSSVKKAASDQSLLLVYAPDARVLVKHLTVVRSLISRPTLRKIQSVLLLKKEILNDQVKVPGLIQAGFHEVVTDEVSEQTYLAIVLKKVEELKAILAGQKFLVASSLFSYNLSDASESAASGEWDFVSPLGANSKLNYYAYISDEVRTGRATYVRSLPKYWIFVGEKAPSLSIEGPSEGEDWIFVGGEPQCFDKYSLLPSQVQTYLRDFKPSPLSAEQIERRTKKKEKKRAPDFQIEVAAVSAKKRIFENTSGLNEEEKKRAAQVMEALGPISKNVKASRLLEADGVENLGPLGVHAQEPPGPTVSALALAFLASELIRRLNRDEALMKYCAYVSASCGGLHTEVWSESNGVAKCLGTHDGTQGSLEELVPIFAHEAKLYGEQVVGAPIVSLDGTKCLGVLMLRGDGVETVPPEYVSSAGEMLRGFLEG